MGWPGRAGPGRVGPRAGPSPPTTIGPMVWDDINQGANTGRDEPIELVGTHLRLTGVISLAGSGGCPT